MTLAYGFVVLAGAAALLACYRLLSGPTRADRVVALDLLFAVAVVLCLTAALVTRRTAFLDVAIGLALVGFVGTMAWARLVERSVAGGTDAGEAMGPKGGDRTGEGPGGQGARGAAP